jgi:hypothetical protein
MDGAARNNFDARVACGPMKTHDHADMMFDAGRHVQQNIKGRGTAKLDGPPKCRYA